MKRLIDATSTTLAGLSLAALLTGCAWSIGDKEGSEGIRTVQPTRGQELSDLKRAFDQGAISEQEFKDQRQRVLDRN